MEKEGLTRRWDSGSLEGGRNGLAPREPDQDLIKKLPLSVVEGVSKVCPPGFLKCYGSVTCNSSICPLSRWEYLRWLNCPYFTMGLYWNIVPYGGEIRSCGKLGFFCLLIPRPIGATSEPYVGISMHHPKILGFELDAIIGWDFDVVSLGEVVSTFCVWKTECTKY